jgi:hypothetical protein
MQFVLTFNQPLAHLERLENGAEAQALMEPWKAYLAQLAEAGVVRGGQRLAPPWTATTVRVRDGRRVVQDGPFAETREIASGYLVIEVASLDEALEWAARSPSSATGSTEVRPVAEPPK